MEDYRQETDGYSFIKAISNCYEESKGSMR